MSNFYRQSGKRLRCACKELHGSYITYYNIPSSFILLLIFSPPSVFLPSFFSSHLSLIPHSKQHDHDDSDPQRWPWLLPPASSVQVDLVTVTTDPGVYHHRAWPLLLRSRLLPLPPTMTATSGPRRRAAPPLASLESAHPSSVGLKTKTWVRGSGFGRQPEVGRGRELSLSGCNNVTMVTLHSRPPYRAAVSFIDRFFSLISLLSDSWIWSKIFILGEMDKY